MRRNHQDALEDDQPPCLHCKAKGGPGYQRIARCRCARCPAACGSCTQFCCFFQQGVCNCACRCSSAPTNVPVRARLRQLEIISKIPIGFTFVAEPFEFLIIEPRRLGSLVSMHACVTASRHRAFARASLYMHHLGTMYRQRTSACAVSLMLGQFRCIRSTSFVTSHPTASISTRPCQSQRGGRSGELYFDTHQRLHVELVRPQRAHSLVQDFKLTGFLHTSLGQISKHYILGSELPMSLLTAKDGRMCSSPATPSRSADLACRAPQPCQGQASASNREPV
jgi:hypothetical protein